MFKSFKHRRIHEGNASMSQPSLLQRRFVAAPKAPCNTPSILHNSVTPLGAIGFAFGEPEPEVEDGDQSIIITLTLSP